MKVNVKSEIKPLKKVFLHRPGRELLNLTPNTLEELLFDDTPYLKIAQQEHDAFAQTLRDNGVEVFYVEELVAEVIASDHDLREKFIKQWIDEAGIHTEYYQKLIYEYLEENYSDAKALVDKTIEGINLTELHAEKRNSLVDLVSEASKMVVLPMPNLYFSRDNFAMIGNGVSLNHMYSVTRNRETIYGEYIFNYHPEFRDTPQYYSRYNMFHIEGGDIHNLSDKVLAIGISQRTEPDAIDVISRNIFNDPTSPVDTILAFNIPNSRAFMHLDTVFTQIDVDKFTIHPGIMGPLTVYEITPNGDDIKIKERTEPLEDILESYLGHPCELIPCGGGDRIAAEREQWNDGSNTLAIAPGKIVVYNRNEVTNAVLREKGLDVLEVPSCELSRGRGGPRCMSMPIEREE